MFDCALQLHGPLTCVLIGCVYYCYYVAWCYLWAWNRFARIHRVEGVASDWKGGLLAMLDETETWQYRFPNELAFFFCARNAFYGQFTF